MKCRTCKATLIGNERKGDKCNKCIDAAIAKRKNPCCTDCSAGRLCCNCDCHFPTLTDKLARSYARELESEGYCGA